MGRRRTEVLVVPFVVCSTALEIESRRGCPRLCLRVPIALALAAPGSLSAGRRFFCCMPLTSAFAINLRSPASGEAASHPADDGRAETRSALVSIDQKLEDISAAMIALPDEVAGRIKVVPAASASVPPADMTLTVLTQHDIDTTDTTHTHTRTTTTNTTRMQQKRQEWQ